MLVDYVVLKTYDIALLVACMVNMLDILLLELEQFLESTKGSSLAYSFLAVEHLGQDMGYISRLWTVPSAFCTVHSIGQIKSVKSPLGILPLLVRVQCGGHRDSSWTVEFGFFLPVLSAADTLSRQRRPGKVAFCMQKWLPRHRKGLTMGKWTYSSLPSQQDL